MHKKQALLFFPRHVVYSAAFTFCIAHWRRNVTRK
ncbi:hypothetical protein [Yokenella regensburgei]